MQAETRFIVAKKNIYKLTRDPDSGLWRDEYGVIWAVRDSRASLDPDDRCGVSPLALPDWHIFRQLNAICGRHDYMYSSPAFQHFNTRKEADEYLEALINQDQYFFWLGRPFKWICRIVGGRFWDNKNTR